MNNSQIIIAWNNEANNITHEKISYEFIIKKLMRKYNITYRQIRIAFMKEVDIDLGCKKTAYQKILYIEKGKQDFNQLNLGGNKNDE